MATLHKKLTARLYQEDPGHTSSTVSALRLVVNRHQPVAPLSECDRAAITDPKCAGCQTHITYTPYPCADIRNIAQALGIEEE